MKKLFLVLALTALALPTIADTPVDVRRAILATAWDLDGEGADADQVVTAANGVIADSTTYTLTANPDTCRLLDLTIVDTNLNSGTLTVTGTDCWDYPLVATYAFTAGDDTGVKSLTVSTGLASGPYFKTVTEVASGVMTGESDETFTLGYAGDTTPAQYPAYGKAMYMKGFLTSTVTTAIGTNPVRWVDLFSSYQVPLPVTTSGVVSTTLTSVSSNGAFTNVSVGDILLLEQDDILVERLVTARASANSITLNASVKIATAGKTFAYKKKFVFADPIDGWIGVKGYDAVFFVLDVDGNTDTGGVISDVTCAYVGPTYEPAVQVDTDTVASAATGTAVTAIDLRLGQYDVCRFGMEFGTNDDDDTGVEDINIAVSFRR